MNISSLSQHTMGQVTGYLSLADSTALSTINRDTRLSWCGESFPKKSLCWTSSAEQLSDLVAVIQKQGNFSPSIRAIRLTGNPQNIRPNSLAVLASLCPELTTFQIDQPAGLQLQTALDLLNHFPQLKRLNLTAGLAMHFIANPARRNYPGVEVVTLIDDPDVVHLSQGQVDNLTSWFPNIVDYRDLQYAYADVLMTSP